MILIFMLKLMMTYIYDQVIIFWKSSVLHDGKKVQVP